MKTIGERIKSIREDLDMTQEELAAKIHRSTRSVKHYEQDERITLDMLRTIAKALDVSIFTLLANTDDIFKLFVSSANLTNLSYNEYRSLKSEFENLIEFLTNKYSK